MPSSARRPLLDPLYGEFAEQYDERYGAHDEWVKEAVDAVTA